MIKRYIRVPGGPKKLTIFGGILGPKKKYFPKSFYFIG